MSNNWSSRAIEQAENITKAYEVMKAWLAHVASFVLFGCLIANIVQIVSPLPDSVIGGIVIVEAIGLDVAGLGLLTLARHARDNGLEKEAGYARATAWLLILIMIATVGTVTAAKLWPNTADLMHSIDNGLILVRVCLIVVYGVVLNALHRQDITPAGPGPDLLEALNTRLAALETSISTMQQQIAAPAQNIEMIQTKLERLTVTVTEIKSQPYTPANTVDATPYTPAWPEQKNREQEVPQKQIPEQKAYTPGATLTPLYATPVEEAPVESHESAIRALLAAEPTLSAYAVSKRLQISPTTANKWVKRINEEG